MCVSKDKIKVELYLTPEELLAIAKVLNKEKDKFIVKGSDISVLLKSTTDDGGESGRGNN